MQLGKRIVMGCVVGLLMATATCHAGCGQNSYWQGCLSLLRGDTEVEFSLLWVRPSTTDQILATSITPDVSPATSAYYLYRSEYDLGYRVGIRHGLGCTRLVAGASVLWSEESHTERKFPLPNGILNGSPVFVDVPVLLAPVLEARGKERIRYLAVDGELSRGLIENPCLCLLVFGGVRYADVKAKTIGDYVGSNPSIQVSNHQEIGMRFHGIGPRLGLDLCWRVWRCWSLVGRLGSSFFFATRPFELHSSGNPTLEVESHFTNLNQLTWGFDGKAGVRLQCSIFCGQLSLEGGVMLDHIVEGLQTIQSTPNYFAQRTLPFSIGGPYGRVSFCF